MINTFPFIGVVESQNDPLKLSRVQVRLYGYNTENKQLLPTEKLQWFNSGVSNSASISGKGNSGHGYKSGSSVFGYCFDPDMQHGIVICSYHGLIDSMPNNENGFSDPKGLLPIEDRINESDVNRLSRNENVSETIVQLKIDDMYVDIPKGDKSVYNEAENEYAAIYPNNEVYETMSGHIVEFDDSEGSRRIHIFHASGTFFEILDDGKLIIKSQSDTYEFSAKTKNIYSKGELNISSDSNINIYSGSNNNIHIIGDVNIDIEGNCNSIIHKNNNSIIKGDNESLIEGNNKSTINGNNNSIIKGDNESLIEGNNKSTINGYSNIITSGNITFVGESELSLTIEKNVSINFNENVTAIIKGNMISEVHGDLSQTVNGSANIQVKQDANIQVDGNAYEVIKGNYSKSISGSCDLIASGVMTIDGSIINLG